MRVPLAKKLSGHRKRTQIRREEERKGDEEEVPINTRAMLVGTTVSDCRLCPQVSGHSFGSTYINPAEISTTAQRSRAYWIADTGFNILWTTTQQQLLLQLQHYPTQCYYDSCCNTNNNYSRQLPSSVTTTATTVAKKRATTPAPTTTTTTTTAPTPQAW
jgi:hypothetical protein